MFFDRLRPYPEVWPAKPCRNWWLGGPPAVTVQPLQAEQLMGFGQPSCWSSKLKTLLGSALACASMAMLDC
jgi:hypothetical protein